MLLWPRHRVRGRLVKTDLSILGNSATMIRAKLRYSNLGKQ